MRRWQCARRPRPRSGSTSATPCAPWVAATTPSPPIALHRPRAERGRALLESGQSQDRGFRAGGRGGDGGPARAKRSRGGGSAPSELRARQGAGGSRGIRRGFRHYAAGAALRSSAYDPEVLTRLVARSKALFTREAFEARTEGGSRSPAPIFIVGLPRVRIDPDRADPGQPFPDRGHDGAAADRFIAETLTPYPDVCLNCRPRRGPSSARPTSSAPGSIVRRTGRASSTRCRTISSTSA